MPLPLLRNLLAGVPAFVPQGVGLLNNPTPEANQVVQATLELIHYTEACRRAAYHLRDLPPSPLACPSLLEYGL